MLIDISKTLRPGVSMYPGDPPYTFEHVKHVKRDGVTVSRIDCGLHTGTHLDAPAHFVEGGKEIHELPVESFTGKAHVIDCTDVERFVEIKDLERKTKNEKQINEVGIVLLKTRNSWQDPNQFNESFISLSPEAAAWLSEQGIKAIGTDGPSIDRFHSGTHLTHFTLMKRDILIYENLVLKDVPADRYTFYGFPLKIEHGEASPVRAILQL